MSAESDRSRDDAATGDGGTGDSFAFAEVEWGADVVELSEHLSRLWRLGGDAKMAVGEMHNVRAGLFGYGRVEPND